MTPRLPRWWSQALAFAGCFAIGTGLAVSGNHGPVWLIVLLIVAGAVLAAAEFWLTFKALAALRGRRPQ